VFGVCCVRWNLRVVMSVYVPSPLQTPQMSFVASEKGFLSHPLRQLVPLKEIKMHQYLLNKEQSDLPSPLQTPHTSLVALEKGILSQPLKQLLPSP